MADQNEEIRPTNKQEYLTHKKNFQSELESN
jgi:hypothetical protein